MLRLAASYRCPQYKREEKAQFVVRNAEMMNRIICLAPIFFSPLLEVALTTDTTHAQASLSQSSQNPLQFKVN